MKIQKILTFVFSMIFLICLFGCNNKEYNKVMITKLTYSTIDYNGGYTVKHLLDFKKNNYYSCGFLSNDKNVEPMLKKTFSEAEEKEFIDVCFKSGLFSINDSYEKQGIIDGGGWELVIEYEDGKIKKSIGSNASPTAIFNKCSTAFYDLCGVSVMGTLPKYYSYPPQISYGFSYDLGDASISDNTISIVEIANYKWNKVEEVDVDLYLLNENKKEKNKFVNECKYQVVLYTSNYDYKEKFINFSLKEYDFNESLTNEKIIYSGKWFKQIQFNIELNKIYVYELVYKNGDYVQYTFNTFCK